MGLTNSGFGTNCPANHVPKIIHIFCIANVDVCSNHNKALQCGAITKKGDVITPITERSAQK